MGGLQMLIERRGEAVRASSGYTDSHTRGHALKKKKCIGNDVRVSFGERRKREK